VPQRLVGGADVLTVLYPLIIAAPMGFVGPVCVCTNSKTLGLSFFFSLTSAPIKRSRKNTSTGSISRVCVGGDGESDDFVFACILEQVMIDGLRDFGGVPATGHEYQHISRVILFNEINCRHLAC